MNEVRKCETTLHVAMLVYAFLGVPGVAGCGSTVGSTQVVDGGCDVELREIEFTKEEPVIIHGLTLDAMEVDISFDGSVLMFNDREKNSPQNKNLHWASRISDTEYQYEGEVTELNTVGVDGTPSFDQHGVLYYTSTASYASNGFKSLYRAVQDSGGAYVPTLLDGLYGGAGFVSVDPDISSHGNFLYYSLFTISQSGPPDDIDLKGTLANAGGGFDPIDASLLANINTGLLEYAPTISNDGLELYFTRADRSTSTILGIFKATRSALDEPFVAVDNPVPAISGIVEAPAFNSDETALYYHRKEQPSSAVYSIYRVTRSLPLECKSSD